MTRTRTLTITVTIPDGAAGLMPATLLRSFADHLAEFTAKDLDDANLGIEDTRRANDSGLPADRQVELRASLPPAPRQRDMVAPIRPLCHRLDGRGCYGTRRLDRADPSSSRQCTSRP